MTRAGAILIFLALMIGVAGVFGGLGTTEILGLYVFLVVGVALLLTGIVKQFAVGTKRAPDLRG